MKTPILKTSKYILLLSTSFISIQLNAQPETTELNTADYSLSIPSVMKYDSYQENGKDSKGYWKYNYQVSYENKSMKYTSVDPFAGASLLYLELDTIHSSKTLETQKNEWAKGIEEYNKEKNIQFIEPTEFITASGIKGYIIYDLSLNSDVGGNDEYRVFFLFPLKTPDNFGKIYLSFPLEFRQDLSDKDIFDKKVSLKVPETRAMVGQSIDEMFRSVRLK